MCVGESLKEKLQHSEQCESLKPSITNCIMRLHATVGTPVAASPTATQCSAVRGTCMHAWCGVGRLPDHTEADKNRPRHTLHMYTSQKKQRHALSCLCAACNSAMLNCYTAAVRTWLLNWEVRLLTLGLSRTDSSALRPENVKESFVVFLPLLDNCHDSTWN
jgi:hypothetical protein